MFKANVLINNGKVEKVGDDILPPSGAKIVDAHG
jgi:imidazolonepropionase-like amidohydrolase